MKNPPGLLALISACELHWETIVRVNDDDERVWVLVDMPSSVIDNPTEIKNNRAISTSPGVLDPNRKGMSSDPQYTQLAEQIVSELEDSPGALLPVLHALQDKLGFVPTTVVAIIAAGLNLSRAEVHGVISFYHYFRSTPPGRNTIQICRAESCQAVGGRALAAHAIKSLQCNFNQTSADGEFTLAPVYCLGNCACSPAIRVGEAIYGHVDAAKFDSIVSELLTRAVDIK
jgi:formate dehydrogenase subunit gamma